jgi:hypothetical protein
MVVPVLAVLYAVWMDPLNISVVSALAMICVVGDAESQAGDMDFNQPDSVQTPPEPGSGQAVDDFGFWLGTWSVSNTNRGNDGLWTDAGRSVAKITPMLDGRVVFERWDGKSGNFSNTFGMSLRYFDEAHERWVVLLSWPGGNPVNAGFGVMEGVFEDGMCVLYPPALFRGPGSEVTGRATRFVFSDAEDESCRWTMQAPVGSDDWRSTWAMAFTRMESDEDIEPGRLPIESPPDQCACVEDSARAADWLIGDWTGNEGVSVYATSINRGCGTVLSVATEQAGEALFVLVYSTNQDAWMAREIGTHEPLKLRNWTVSAIGPEVGLELVGPKGAKLRMGKRAGDQINLELVSPDGETESFELRE